MLNIIINYLLIPILGVEGASIATLVGYVVSDIICVIILCHMGLMIVSKKFVIASLVMAGFVITWRLLFSNLVFVGTVAAVLVMIVMALLYWEEIKKTMNIVKNGKTKT